MFLVLDYSNNESTLKYGQLGKFTSVFSSCLFCEKIQFNNIEIWSYLFLVFVSKAEHRERSKFKSERNDLESSYAPVSAPAPNSSEQYSSGAQSIPSTVTVIAPAHHSENTTESWSNYYNNHSSSNSFGRNPPPKRRCRDYDGKTSLLYCTPEY